MRGARSGRALSVPAPARRLLGELARAASGRGARLYAVGGCVRDWLLGRRVLDVDVAAAGDPGPVAARAAELLGARPEPFARFGTVRVVGRGGLRVDVAATREESYPQPACLPEVSAVGVPIERDLRRRDFTVNAMAVRFDDGSFELVDPWGGAGDLRARVLRALHGESFRDDPTRAFRAARFSARFGLRPEPGLLARARAALSAGHAARLSRQRIFHEFWRVLEEAEPRPALGLLRRWGYLDLVQPGLRLPSSLPPGPERRLAAFALAQRARARRLIEGLPMPHELRRAIEEAESLAFSPGAPKEKPSPFALAAARAARPGLPGAAWRPRFLRGADLLERGLSPGPSFHLILDEAARLQRLGRLRGRAAALAWLRARR